METIQPKLSLRRVLWTDYPAFYASLVPIVAWVVYLAWSPDWRGKGSVLTPGARPYYLWLAILATVISLGVLGWRLWLLASIFHKGTHVRGKISNFVLHHDHGHVEYCYIFDHREFKSNAKVHRNAQTKRLKSGDLVILQIDKRHPARAFIRDLYSEP